MVSVVIGTWFVGYQARPPTLQLFDAPSSAVTSSLKLHTSISCLRCFSLYKVFLNKKISYLGVILQIQAQEKIQVGEVDSMKPISVNSRIYKYILIIVGSLVGVLIVFLLVASMIYPREYVYRVLVWRDSDVDDYRYNFPQRRLTAASKPSPFEEAVDMNHVATVFEAQPEIDDLESYLANSETLAFIVIQDGAVVYENYFNGTQRDTLVTSFSVAKSFTSALIGIAIDEGYIHSLDDPITDYLPELLARQPRFGDITVRHLLLMASGLDYKENRAFLFNGDDPLTTYYPDQRQLALENINIIDAPGVYFQYNKYHPQLLGMIIERATGVSVTEYMQRTLWEPLGMEFDGGWSLDSTQSGFEKMEAGLNGRAIDFAKFGQLFLDNGSWEGVQVIPSTWVAESTQMDPALHNESYYPTNFGQVIYDSGKGYYQYMWYGRFHDDGSYDFFAEGDRGQLIYMSPGKNLVIVRFGEDFGIPGGIFAWPMIFHQFVKDF